MTARWSAMIPKCGSTVMIAHSPQYFTSKVEGHLKELQEAYARTFHQQNAGICVLGWPTSGSVHEKDTQCIASQQRTTQPNIKNSPGDSAMKMYILGWYCTERADYWLALHWSPTIGLHWEPVRWTARSEDRP